MILFGIGKKNTKFKASSIGGDIFSYPKKHIDYYCLLVYIYFSPPIKTPLSPPQQSSLSISFSYLVSSPHCKYTESLPSLASVMFLQLLLPWQNVAGLNPNASRQYQRAQATARHSCRTSVLLAWEPNSQPDIACVNCFVVTVVVGAPPEDLLAGLTMLRARGGCGESPFDHREMTLCAEYDIAFIAKAHLRRRPKYSRLSIK